MSDYIHTYDFIYVVMGTQGEYSDRTEWPVCYFNSEEEAQKYVLACGRRQNEVEIAMQAWDEKHGYTEPYPENDSKFINEYDAVAARDYPYCTNGASYFYSKVARGVPIPAETINMTSSGD